MEFVLVIVTIVSLTMAVAMAALGWRMLRDSRARTAARVEALEALAAEGPVHELAPRVVHEPAQRSARFATIDEDESHDLPMRGAPPPARVRPVEVSFGAARASASEPARTERGTGVPASERVGGFAGAEPPELIMFGGAVERGTPSRRWFALGVVGIVMALLTLTVYAIMRPGALTAAFSQRLSAQAAARATTTAEPLQLLSLKHSIDADGTFSVIGLVQNPPAGQAFHNIAVVLYLFAPDGSYFANGKANIDVTTFEPGAESPFVIHVPNAGKVGRYRIGFRLEDGAVVAHVDRRGASIEGTETVDVPRAVSTKGI